MIIDPYKINPTIIRNNNLYQWIDAGLSSTALDQSGNSRNGTLTNGTAYNVFGNGSFLFDGTDDYIALGNYGSWPDYGTINFWMYPTEVVNFRNPFHTHLNGVNAGLRFEMSTGGTFGVLFGTDAGTFTGHTITSSLTANNWYLVTVTWDKPKSIVYAYLNGAPVVVAAFNGTWATTIPSVTLGRGFSTDAARQFKGYISSYFFYTDILSADAVSYIFYATRARHGL